MHATSHKSLNLMFHFPLQIYGLDCAREKELNKSILTFFIKQAFIIKRT